ncbi:MAG: acyl carrier protein [Hyalangium sp.]|uniref:acyl carrier protein n=1 Tax=Hyalangium sp. TaxID=2028555 RepID=UPI00389A6E40
MEEQVIGFVLKTLKEKMNLSIPDTASGASSLGPDGLNLESLEFVELSVHVEHEFGVKFSDAEFETIARYNLGQFAQAVLKKQESGKKAAAGG